MHRKTLSFLLMFTLIALTGLSLAEDVSDAPRDFSGRWKVLLSNSLSRKQVTFDIKQEDGRLRGNLLAKGMPEMDLDGRFEGDNRVILWGTYYERSGVSHEYQFKAAFEGDPGEETLVGTARYFDKRYDIVGERVE